MLKISGRVFLSALLFCSAAVAWSADADRLGSCGASEYRDIVDNVTDVAIREKAQLSVTILPSFEAEAGVRVTGDSVFLVQFDRSFWAQSWVKDKSGASRHDFTVPRVKVQVNQAVLSPEVIARILLLYRAAIAEATEAAAPNLDGVSFYFSMNGAGCGTVNSPDKGSKMDRLSTLVKLLANHAEAANPVAVKASETRIVAFIDSLAK